MHKKTFLFRLQNLLGSLNLDFILLLALVLFGNRQVFDVNVWPDNDTLFSFQMFYGFYNNFFFHHELVRWLPYAAYGIQADYWQLIFLTPAMYFTAVAGKLAGVTNVLMLFKAAVLLELCISLTGMYLLSRLLFRFRGTVLLVCLGTLASTLWLFQINWNFRIFYLLPLICYFLVLFAREKKGHYLWLAGLVFVAQQIGVPPYFSILHFLILTILLACLVIRKPAAISCLSKINFLNLVCLGGFLLATGVYLQFAFHILDYIRIDQMGRSSNSYMVSLKDFLTYSPVYPLINFKKFLGLFYGGFKNLAATIYVGILPVIFIFYAAIKVRKPLFLFFLGLTLFLAIFSAGDPFLLARILYFIYPPIRLFRYIGMLSGLIRPFLLILAGFGMDHFLSCLHQRSRVMACREKSILWDTSAIIFILMGILAFAPVEGRLFDWLRPDFYFYSQFLALIAISIIAWRKLRPSNASALILLFFALDILSYQNLHNANWPLRLPDIAPAIQNVFNYSFQKTRVLPPDFREANPRAQLAYPMILSTPHHLHTETSTFLLADFCYPIPNNHYLNTNIDRLMNHRFSAYHKLLQRFPGMAGQLDQSKTSDYQAFKNAVGCYQSKLQLLTNIHLIPDQTAAETYVTSSAAIDQTVGIESASEYLSNKQQTPDPGEKAGTIFVKSFSFNKIALDVSVQAPDGAWLYYLDAWHPGWKAWVDGKATTIARGNMAFKAVRLSPGKHSVRLIYADGLQGIRAHLIALFGVLFAATCLVTALAISVKRRRDSSD